MILYVNENEFQQLKNALYNCKCRQKWKLTHKKLLVQTKHINTKNCNKKTKNVDCEKSLKSLVFPNVNNDDLDFPKSFKKMLWKRN